MQPADHQAVGVDAAAPVVVEGAHDPRAFAFGQRFLGVTNIVPCPGLVYGPAFRRQLRQPVQQEGPFDACVVLEETGAAVLGAVVAGQAQCLGVSRILGLHVGIEADQFAEGLSGEQFFDHDGSC